MVTSSIAGWRLLLIAAGVFSSCCLALDSSSSFPCPAFRAIAKSTGLKLKDSSPGIKGLHHHCLTGIVLDTMRCKYKRLEIEGVEGTETKQKQGETPVCDNLERSSQPGGHDPFRGQRTLSKLSLKTIGNTDIYIVIHNSRKITVMK
ncbi:hypothetical protein STEG23_006036 [Scotinomys teguina]